MNLLRSRNFFPLFWTQFLDALNDNLFKNAMIMFFIYLVHDKTYFSLNVIVTVAAAAFVLPYFLFSATAGQLADKYDRARLTRIIKLSEIPVMLFGTFGLFVSNIYLLIFIVFLLGTQAAFFGPIKYAILPQHLKGKELLSGNGYIEAGTFLAILLGTILGSILVTIDYGVYIVSGTIFAIAVLGYYFSCLIPTAPAPAPGIKVNYNFANETAINIRHSMDQKDIFLYILAISWFWFIGVTYLTQLPAFVKETLGAEPTVVTLFLTIFSLGIGAGSLMCNRLLKGQSDATYVPLATIGMAVFGMDLYFASKGVPIRPSLLTLTDFLMLFTGWRLIIDVFFIAVCGGLYVVPLYVFIQQKADPSHLARTIAGLNIINAIFMVFSSLFAIILFKLSFTIPDIFLVLSIINFGVAVYSIRLIPNALFRSIVKALLTWLYRVEVKGFENLNAAGKRVLIIANHTSLLDGMLIAAFLPVKITFAIDTHMATRWWLAPFLKLVDTFPLDTANPLALKSLIEVIKKNNIGMIFPEGRVTITGSLMKVYEGSGLIADKAQAKLLPVRIEGAQYTPFSYLKGKVKIHLFPKITLTILSAREFNLPPELFGKKRRQTAAEKLYNIMSEMMFESSNLDQPLFSSLLDARRLHGGNAIVAEDPQRRPLTYRTFISRSMVLGRLFKRYLGPSKTTGVLLPNMVTTALTFFGLHSIAYVPAMLNFTAGPAQIAAACKTAKIGTVITSREFIGTANLDPMVSTLKASGVSILYLEDLHKKIRLSDRIFGLFALFIPEALNSRHMKVQPHDTAVVLFTSGSEETPKGVALSHRNIQSNRFQLVSRVDFGPSDIVFNCLPMFHSFGLTAGTLLPVFSGIRTFYYPSPLHYRIIPELIYDTGATLLFSTGTFLNFYAHFAHPYDLNSIRYAFAGAEKLKDETRKTYFEKYGVRLFEGYGVTEASPVISVNTPMNNKSGTVGQILPGMNFKIEAIEGMKNAGLLWVTGPNIMLGYLKADAPGVLQPPKGGWYNTGDIVSVDGEGYMTIQGRMKRFAKIGGEMISLMAVEQAVQELYPQAVNAVISINDAKKGERLALFTTQKSASISEIIAYFKTRGWNELSIPKRLQILDAVPLLGSGKIDYVTLQQETPPSSQSN